MRNNKTDFAVINLLLILGIVVLSSIMLMEPLDKSVLYQDIAYLLLLSVLGIVITKGGRFYAIPMVLYLAGLGIFLGVKGLSFFNSTMRRIKSESEKNNRKAEK